MYELDVRTADSRDVDGICRVMEQVSSESQPRVDGWLAAGAIRVVEHNSEIVGFAVTEPTFFGNDFVDLVQVSPRYRRIGAASALLEDASVRRTSAKLFTSTNLSNTAMQVVLRGLRWESAGIVYGLDDGDPELFFQAPARRG